MGFVIGNQRSGALAFRETMDHAADCLLTMLRGTGQPMDACIVAAAHALSDGPGARVNECLQGWYIVEQCDDYDQQYQRIIDEISGLTLEQARHFLEDGEALSFKAIHNQLAVEDVYQALSGLING